MENINLGVVNNFVVQIALVTREENITSLPAHLEATFRPALHAITQYLGNTVVSPTSTCSLHANQVFNAFMAQARMHIDSTLILQYINTFLHKLGNTIADCHKWRVREIDLTEGLGLQDRKTKKRELSDSTENVLIVIGGIVRLLEEEIWPSTQQSADQNPTPPESAVSEPEIPYANQPLDDTETKLYWAIHALVYPEAAASPAPAAPIEPVASVAPDAHLESADSAVRTPKTVGKQFKFKTVLPKKEVTPAPDRSSTDPTPPARTPSATPGPSTRGHNSVKFTDDQKKAIILWMKENEAWSVAGHKEAFDSLIALPMFAGQLANLDDEDKEKALGKMKRRVKDKMDKSRQKLIKQGAATTVDIMQQITKDVKKGRGRGFKGHSMVQETKEVKRNGLEFEDWTDGWLEENWDGSIERKV